MAVLFTSPYFQGVDDNGNPLSGGKVYTFAAGTDTPKPTFTTAAATQEHENPIILDAAGRAVIFIQGSYKYVIRDAEDNIIRTVDNVTSFTALESAGDSFFQSFTGNGTQTVFTLSEPLGTDSNAVMVFIEEVPIQNIENGDFAADEDWTKGAGWTIGSGVATATGDISTALTQPASVAIVENQAYVVQYTVTRSAGGVTPSVGGRAGVERTASGTYTEIIVAGSTQDIAFTGNAFTGTLDDVKVSLVAFNGDTFLNPNQYSLSGTSITFVNAPADGAIIKITAPSLLIGAASAAAEIAENAETGALAAQSAAEDARDAAEDARDAAIVAQGAAETAETNAETAETNAEAAQDLAEQWASKVDGIVDATDYAAKAWAIGGTGTETNNAKFYSEQALINSGFVWAGMWSAGTYTINQAVEHNGSSWIVTVASTTGEPGVSGDWDLLAEKGADGTGLTDGDKGDITVSSAGAVWDINAGVVSTTELGGNITAAGKALLDDANAAAQRTTLGLGTAAVEDVGTAIGDVVQLEDVGGNAGLPAVDGSQLTGLAIGGGLIGVKYYTCPTQNVTINVASPAVFTGSAVSLPEIGAEVQLTTTGTLPTPLATGTTYYVVAKPTATTIHLSTSKGGAPIATTVAGSGTHTITNAPYEKAENNPSFITVTVVGGTGATLTNVVGSNASAGGGGGGGAKKTINNSDIASSEIVTCGSAGSSGVNGGTSSFGSHCSATGGASPAGGVNKADGGVGIGGDINVTGQIGINAGGASPSAYKVGGASAFGLSFGASAISTVSVNGGPGIIIVEEYS